MNNLFIQLKAAPPKVPILLNVIVLGLLAGLSFCVQFGLLPLLSRMDATAYVTTMQGIIPTFTHAVVPLMMIGLATFLVRLIWLRSPCAGMQYWTLVSFAFFLAGALITVAGHFPLNAQLLHWPAPNPPADWMALRQKWGELNFWRFAVGQVGFICVLVPLIFARRRPSEVDGLSKAA